MRYRNGRQGFTLIELMIVVIIIAALAAMVIPRLIPASAAAQKKIAKGDIAEIEVALDLYRLYVGSYPTTAEGLDILLQVPKSGDVKEPVLDKPAIDPRNRKFEYLYPGTHNTTKYDLWSDGANPSDASDDVNNWQTDQGN